MLTPAERFDKYRELLRQIDLLMANHLRWIEDQSPSLSLSAKEAGAFAFEKELDRIRAEMRAIDIM